MTEDDRHAQEVQRFATLLREVADKIEENPNRIRWDESYEFVSNEAGRLTIDLDYRGNLAFLSQQLDAGPEAVER